LANGLKEIVDYVNKSDEWIRNKEEILTAIKGGTVIVRTLDWILNAKDIDYEEFCKKTDESFTKEFGLDKF
jgi:hypothetical protein